MNREDRDPTAAAARSLAEGQDAVDGIRSGDPLLASPSQVHIATGAIERALRRLLRDHPSTPDPLRLDALAADELDGPAVLSHLHEQGVLSDESERATRDALELDRFLQGGGEVDAAAAVVVLRAWEAMEAAVDAPRAEGGVSIPVSAPARSAESRRTRRRGASGPIGWIVVLAAIAVMAVLFVPRERGAEHMEQGISLFSSGEFANAAHHFWRYAEQNPRDATPQIYLARIHRRLERPELASEALDLAESLDPGNAAVERERAFLLLDAGNPDAAVTRFRESVNEEPESIEGWLGLQRALRESGRADEAEAILGEAPGDVAAAIESGSGG